MFQEYQNLRKNNGDPNEFLNKVVNGFDPQKRQQWDNMMGMFNQRQG